MGKKVKKKIRNTQLKDMKDTSGSHGSSLVQSNQSDEAVDGVVVEEKKTACKHIENGVNLEKISDKIKSRSADKCDDCREGTSERKGRSKHGKKGAGSVGKKKDSKSVWVCLQCGQFSCGAVGMPTTPQCHAIVHSKKNRHPYVMQLQNPKICWCFSCNSYITVGKVIQEDGVENNVLADIAKLIKAGPSEGMPIDVEDIWFGSGSVGGATSSGITESSVSDRKEGYVARGLSNLGNTCFFNSVMQNLLAMNQLRNYFLKLDCSAGPLTMALKKLFADTSFEANSKYGTNPKNLFGCICSKAPQFRGYQQQDSHELLRCLLDGLSTEEINMKRSVGNSKEDGSTTTSSASTFVEAIFGGQLSSTISCVECNYTSVVHEPFLDVSLPVPTKKSPSKKVPLVSRYRKAKPPLKYEARKGGKIRGKGKTDSVPPSIPCATSSSKTVNSSSLVPSSLPTEEEKACSSLASSSAPLEDENVDSSLASSSIPLEEEKLDSVDNDCWLDYLGEDISSSALDSVSPNNDILITQNSENKQTSEGDGVFHDSSESQNQVFSPSTEPTQNLELPKSSSGDDLPLIQGSEVLLLPYKDESLVTGETVSKECEASSSGLDYEQEVDIEGLGDLFYEPEIASVPNSDDKISQDSELKQASLVAAISSESDPDEVDDRDAPVSISSCLACFTKPEVLSGEHAWHCENCSKTLQNPQLQSREDQSKTTGESKSIENGYLEIGVGSTIEGDEDLRLTFTLQAVLPITNDCTSNNQASSFDQASGSCCVNDFNITESHVSQAHCMVSNSKGKTTKLDGNDGGDGKSVKVMRAATKKILINKAPPILTIHLKRFSQDARGRLSKLSGHVTFQDKIDLNPYMSPRASEETKCEYHLIGIVEHSGTMRGGHYVAYVRGERKKGKNEQGSEGRHTWFYASDAYVREVSLAEVFRSEAYILFYESV